MEGERDAPTLAEAREEILARLGGLSLAPIAAAILDRVGERGDRPFSLEDALRDAGKTSVDGEVMAALSHLVACRRPALDRSVVFVDRDGAEHPVDVVPEEGQTFAHPVTGEAVANATSRMYLRFAPVPGLLREHEASPPGP